jgi:hypothetical protein
MKRIELKSSVKEFITQVTKRIAVLLNTAFLFYILLSLFNVIPYDGSLSFKDFFTNSNCGKYWMVAIIFNILSGYFHPERFKSIDWIWIVVFYILTLTGFCITC